jgi:hypothetical protein
MNVLTAVCAGLGAVMIIASFSATRSSSDRGRVSRAAASIGLLVGVSLIAIALITAFVPGVPNEASV